MMVFISILIVLFSFGITQETVEGNPKSFETRKLNILNEVEMSFFSIDEMLIEDGESEPGTPFRYGKIFDVDYNLNNSGTWDILDNGDKLWRLKISSNDAYAIGLEYNYFNLPEGSKFYVYSEDKNNIYGAYTYLNNQSDYLFATPLVKGQTIIVEYYEPYNASFEGEIYISEVIHDYKDILSFFNEGQSDRLCGTNTVCDEAGPYEDLINAVSWLDMGGFICSGSMLNNMRMDLEPYYMTAWHCTDGDQPSSFRFYFNYEASSCTSGNGSYGSYVYGSQLLATSNGMDSDWSLLKINGNIQDSWNVFYAGWDRSTSNPTVSCAIHHPGGSPKRINFDDDVSYSSGWNNNQPTHWRVFWDDGGTEGGSSGCPVYDENFRFRGQLSGGPDVPCEDNGSYDLYGKFDRAWNSIDQWLDPDNTGAMYVDGTYDGTTIVEGCTDMNAENYDSTATDDDGSCFYGIADLYFGNTSSEYLEIRMNNSNTVAGFQFTILDPEDLIILEEASGGSADYNGFEVSTSELGIVIGFSFSGGSIPEGDDILTNLSFSLTGSGTSEICVTEQVISDMSGNPLDILFDNCTLIELNDILTGDINADTIINIQDVVILINIILGNGDFTNAGDLNSDGINNVQDIVQLIGIILGD